MCIAIIIDDITIFNCQYLIYITIWDYKSSAQWYRILACSIVGNWCIHCPFTETMLSSGCRFCYSATDIYSIASHCFWLSALLCVACLCVVLLCHSNNCHIHIEPGCARSKKTDTLTNYGSAALLWLGAFIHQFHPEQSNGVIIIKYSHIVNWEWMERTTRANLLSQTNDTLNYSTCPA